MNSLIHGIQISTFSGWLVCLLGYVAGFRIPQTWQLDFPEKPKPLQVMNHFDFALGSPDLIPTTISESLESLAQEATAASAETPPTPAITEMTAAAPPAMPALADTSSLPEIPEISTQVIRKVANRLATPRSNTTSSEKKATSRTQPDTAANSGSAPTTATTLTLGTGVGRQPSPQYPYQARRSNQQGTVIIEFIVGVDGHVMSAWVKSPSAWPLLNNTALSTVRSRWKFPTGSPRRYCIPIVFRLS